MGFTTHFYGQEISDYGKEHGYVDYRALAKSFEGVLNNNIVSHVGWENWEVENGSLEYCEYDGDRYSYSELEELIFTDTIPFDTARCPKVKIVSVADPIAQTILAIQQHRSVSELNIK